MKKRVPLMVAAVAVLALLITAVRVFILNGPAADPHSVLASGTIEVTEVRMAFRMPGILAERPVDEGSEVARGALLATLDRREAVARQAEAEAAVRVARATLAELENGFRPEEIAQAEAALREASVNHANLHEQARRSQALFDGGGISQERLDHDVAAAVGAAARQQAAAARLQLLRSGHRAEQIENARARLAQAEAALQVLQVSLDDMAVHSPIAGVVTRTHGEVGETLAAGRPVVTVAELAAPRLRVYIPEGQIGRIAIGAAAEVAVDSFPGRRFPGKVSYVSAQAEFTPKNVQTQEERVKLVFAVDVQLDNPEGVLKPGMPADVVIRAAGN